MREKSNHQTTKLKSMVKVEEGKVRTWWLEEILPREGPFRTAVLSPTFYSALELRKERGRYSEIELQTCCRLMIEFLY